MKKLSAFKRLLGPQFSKWCLIGALVGAPCGLIVSCLTAPQKRAALTLDCRVRLLEPYVGALTPELIRETIVNGPRQLIAVLVELGTDPEEIKRVGEAWKACSPPKPPPTEPKPLPPVIPEGALPKKLMRG